MEMFVLRYVDLPQTLLVPPNGPTYLPRYCSPNLCKRNYLFGNLPFYKIQVNRLWPGMNYLVPFLILRHSFLFINRLQVTI